MPVVSVTANALKTLYESFPKELKTLCSQDDVPPNFHRIQDPNLRQQIYIYFIHIITAHCANPQQFMRLFPSSILHILIIKLLDANHSDEQEMTDCLAYINLMIGKKIDFFQLNQIKDYIDFYMNYSSMLLKFCNKHIKTKEALYHFCYNQHLLNKLFELGFRPNIKKQRPLFLSLAEKSSDAFFGRIQNVLGNYLLPLLSTLSTQDLLKFNQKEFIKIHFDHEDPPLILIKYIQIIVNGYRYQHRVPYGPINLPTSNRLLEQLIEAILDTDVSEIECMTDNSGYIDIEIPDRFPLVNLSMLFKNCDLSSWDTTETNIQRINDYLQLFFDIDLHKTLPTKMSNQVLARLNLTLQGAIQFYSSKKYDDINPLMRGMPFIVDKDSKTKFPVALVLITSLIATALNQLPQILHEKEVYATEKSIISRMKTSELESLDETRILPNYRLDDKEAFEAAMRYSLAAGLINKDEAELLKCSYQGIRPLLGGYGLLKRIEYYSEGETIAYTARNPHRFTTFLSTSTRHGKFLTEKEDAANLKIYHQLHGRFANQVSIRELSIHPHEDEVLLSPGLQYALLDQGYTTDGSMFIMDAILLRSPEFYTDEYASSTALIHAANYYLDKEFTEQSDSQKLFGITLHRPNHGVVHTHAVMKYIPMVVSFFSVHAKDEAFRDFCARISPMDMECLKMIAAFSVTGRESEEQSKSGSSKIAQFRKDSAKYLRMYLKMLPAFFFVEDPQAIIARCVEITKYFGNPSYESEINTAQDIEERNTRCYYHRIISLAHTLDLPRCWVIEDFKQAMQYYNNFVIISPKWREDLTQMISYACYWIEKRGDMLFFKVDYYGDYTPVSIEYNVNFVLNSTNIYLLAQRSNKSPCPLFEPPQQELTYLTPSLNFP